MPTTVLKVGDKVKVRGTDWPHYKLGHAPQGGRAVDGGKIYEKPFVFLIATAVVLDNSGTGSGYENRDAVVVNLNDVVEVEGYGQHRIEFWNKGDRTNLAMVRLADGFRS